MKRCVTFLLIVGILCSLTACNAQPVVPTDTSVPTTVPTQAPTAAPETQPTEPAPTTAPTQPPVEETEPEPPTEPVPCQHRYKSEVKLAASCEKVGLNVYTCEKCAHRYTQSTPPTGHRYSSGKCTRCGQPEPVVEPTEPVTVPTEPVVEPTEPEEVTFTVKVKTENNKPAAGVTVSVSTDDPQQSFSAVTDENGVAEFTLKSSAGYRVVLADIPADCTASESYVFTDTRANITLKYKNVGHGSANYAIGSTMQDFTVVDTDGNVHTLSKILQEKQLVVLNFWFVGCGPCREEFPYFETAHQRYGDQIQILAMNHIDDESSIRELQDRMGLTFPMISENLGMQEGFGISAYPTTVIINSSGVIISIRVGSFPNEAEFLQMLEGLIQQ